MVTVFIRYISSKKELSDTKAVPEVCAVSPRGMRPYFVGAWEPPNGREKLRGAAAGIEPPFYRRLRAA